MSFTVIVSILFGWLAGLLINYLADVLPLTRRFSQPACPHCNVPFAWQDYLLFKPCTNGHTRNARPWVVQFVIVVISSYSWLNPPSKIGYALGMILLIYFGIVFVIDLEHRLILHPTSIFGAIFGLIIGTIAHGIGPTLWGGLGGFVIMIALYYFGVLFARIRTRRLIAAGQEPDDEEALGAGDVILITILGFILGWPLIWFGFLLGVLLGGFFSLLIIAWLVIGRQYKQNAMMMFIPYGPYFVASAFLVVFFPKFLAMIVPG